MSIDPRSPVLVGAGAVSQRADDPALALEPCDLMARALERAGDDAGDRALLREAALVAVPRGLWGYADPGRLVAERIGAAQARTLCAEVGILQTALFAEAARAIRAGADVVLVTGGEARHRAARARAAGQPERLAAEPPGAAPDRVLRPAGEIVHPVEIARGFVQPVAQYAAIESALRRDAKQSIDEHRAEVAALYAGFARIAAANPDAWSRKPMDARALLDPAVNPPLAFPYGKRHCSQWTVDQAAGLLFCSAERARRAGIPERRWVFPRAIAESNHMRPLVARASLARAAGVRLAWERALAQSGLAPEAILAREIYSCFPSAVRVQLREMGLAAEPTPSWTGGMAFAGGPLNNFVLQGAARMPTVLRERGGAAVLTAVSGMLTKHGVSLWSMEPGDAGFGYADVSDEAARVDGAREVATDAVGEGEVAGYTVLYEGGAPLRTIAIVDRDDGRRSVASSVDPALAQRGTEVELGGMRVSVTEDGRLLV